MRHARVVLAFALVVAASVGCQSSERGLGGRGGSPGAGGIATGGAGGGLGTRPTTPMTCANPTGPKKAMGLACSCADECASGFCVDGVCCDGACDGVCQACNVESRPGQCTPIPAGRLPVVPGQCKTEAASTCGFDGTCDGAGACRRHPDGTVCATGTCAGSTVTGTKVCAGGACREGPVTTCSPYACNSATGKCHTSCTANSQCDGRECKSGMCGKKPLGAMCNAAAECDSGFCADGVCCNLACTGACVSCARAGMMGECGPVSAGMADPHGVCKKEDPTTCGPSGLCNGQGGCAKYASGTVCKPASCSGGSQIPASTCNGAGTCVLGTPVSCFPFVCAGTSCKATCSSNTDCAAGNTCTMGSCGKKLNGQSCQAASECRSNFCADGVCCESACTGSCRYCAFPNSRGRCVNTPAGVPDPRNVCQDKGPAACNSNGKCNGNGACEMYATGTVCKPESCDVATNRYTQEGVCRNGACAAPPATSCAPYKCNGIMCGSSCANNDQCTTGNLCLENSCGKKPQGALCSRAGECQSGFCAQGVCCGSACTSGCFSCNLPGMAGICAPVPAGGADPMGACRDEGASSCGSDGMCNGMGSCRKYASGTVCAAATCAAGTATAAATCDGAGKCVTGSARACSPYACNMAGSDCYSSCTDDSQCVAPTKCDATGRCGRKKNGSSCSDPMECESNICVEGVCCNSDCAGLCKTCALAGALGTCTNVPSGGSDPAGRCVATAESTCGLDGTCDGAGACRNWGTSTQCRVASCPADSASLSKAAACDGKGMCPASQMQACAPYKCDATSNTCRTSCASDADCSSGTCSNGSCGKKALGASCAEGAECESGKCVDGTCCSTVSCGVCQTCANAQGVCANVAVDGSDPDSCADKTSTEACGTTGKCDGAGKCKLAAAGTACGKGCANNDKDLNVRACDGAGTCGGMPMRQSCNGFLCQGNACLTSCTPGTNAGCVAGKICLNNLCQDPLPVDAGL